MNEKEEYQRVIHYTMSCIGGFLGAYAILNRSDLFGNAQTSNLIYIAMHLLGGNFFDVMLRVIGMITYMAGIASTVLWKKRMTMNIHYYAVTVDILTMIVLGFIPQNVNSIVALYPIFFAAAVQWNSFPGVFGYNSSTIFSTNNLRQFTMGLTESICDKNNKKQRHKAKFYGGVLLCYHIGVTIGFFAVKMFAIKGAWVGIIIASAALGLVIYENIDFVTENSNSKSNIMKKVA